MPLEIDHAIDEAVRARYAADADAQRVQGEGPTGIGPGPYAALIGGNAADLFTTLDAIRSKRGVEGNPVMRGMGPGGIAAMKIGGTAAQVLALKALSQKKPTLAKWLGYGLGGAMGGLAIHNARAGR